MIDPAEDRMVHSDSDGAAERILNLHSVGNHETQNGLFQGVSMANIGRVRPSESSHGVGPLPNPDEDLGIFFGEHQFLAVGEKAKESLGRSRAPGGGIGEEEVEEAEGGAKVGGVGEGKMVGGEEGGGGGIGIVAFGGAVAEEIGMGNWGIGERGEAGGAVSEEEGIMESGGEGWQWRSNVFRHFYVFHCSHFHLHFCLSSLLLCSSTTVVRGFVYATKLK